MSEVIFTALEEPAMSCVMDSFLQMVHAGMHWMRCFCTAVRKKGISALAAMQAVMKEHALKANAKD